MPYGELRGKERGDAAKKRRAMAFASVEKLVERMAWKEERSVPVEIEGPEGYYG